MARRRGLWGSNSAGAAERGLRAGWSWRLSGTGSYDGVCAGLSLCRWWVTASARTVGGRLGSRVLQWLGRGKRSVGGTAGVSGGHEVSSMGGLGLAGLSTSMMTMRPYRQAGHSLREVLVNSSYRSHRHFEPGGMFSGAATSTVRRTSRRAGLPTCWLMITESGNVPTVCLDGDLAAEVTPGAASARRTLFVTRQELYLACPNAPITRVLPGRRT